MLQKLGQKSSLSATKACKVYLQAFFCIPTPHNFTTPPLRSFPIISSAINLNRGMRDMDYGSASLRYESPIVDDGNPVTTELVIKSD